MLVIGFVFGAVAATTGANEGGVVAAGGVLPGEGRVLVLGPS